MLDVNTLTVSELIELVRKDHQDHKDREAEIARIEHKIFKLNSDIYAITQRGARYRTDGSKYLKALNEAIVKQ
jgi:hypothetical protein